MNKIIIDGNNYVLFDEGVDIKTKDGGELANPRPYVFKAVSPFRTWYGLYHTNSEGRWKIVGVFNQQWIGELVKRWN